MRAADSPSETRARASAPSVIVPVLSRHTTSTRPSASIAFGFLTSAPRRESRSADASSAAVARSGRPSGTEATARLTPDPTRSSSFRPRSRPPPTTPTPAAIAIGPVRLMSSPSRRSTPPGPRAPFEPAAPRRASVCRPTATTTAVAWPETRVVPSYSIDVRSAAWASNDGVENFFTGRDSPVRLDASTSTAVASRMRQSAGTTSPVASSTTSPGTSSVASMLATRPSRRTSARRLSVRARIRIFRSVANRCMPPKNAFSPTTPPTIAASAVEPTAAESPAPAARSGASGLKSSSVMASPSSRIWVGAAWVGALRSATSVRVRPCRVLVNRPSTPSASSACHGVGSRDGGNASRLIAIDPRTPLAIDISVPALTTNITRRAVSGSRPPAETSAPNAAAPSAMFTLCFDTSRARTAARSKRRTSARSSGHSTCAPHGVDEPGGQMPIPKSASGNPGESPVATRQTPRPSRCRRRIPARIPSRPPMTSSALTAWRIVSSSAASTTRMPASCAALTSSSRPTRAVMPTSTTAATAPSCSSARTSVPRRERPRAISSSSDGALASASRHGPS